MKGERKQKVKGDLQKQISNTRERERQGHKEKKNKRDRNWEERERGKNRQEIQCENRVKDNMERNMKLQKQIN